MNLGQNPEQFNDEHAIANRSGLEEDGECQGEISSHDEAPFISPVAAQPDQETNASP